MRKVITLLFVGSMALSLNGCGLIGGNKAETDNGNLEVNTPDASVKVEDGNVDINTPGAKVKTENGKVEIETSKGNGSDVMKKRNVILVMDASGSMNAMSDGKSKMSIAKTSAGVLVDKMKNDANLGVISYGHIGGNSQAEKSASCNGIEEIYYFGAIDSKIVKSKINNLPAKGWTPIAKSLAKAKTILASHPGERNEILLVSDGEETCGGDPVALAKEICAAGMRVDVIGFNVSGVAEAQLKNISIGGCGAYASVDNAADFNVITNGDGLHVRASGTIVDIQGGVVKVDTADAMVEAGPGGVNVKTDGVDVKAGDGGVEVDIPSMPSTNY